MRNSFLAGFIILLINLCGCSWHPSPKLPTIAETPLKEERIFKPEKFTSGGNLLVVPFSAGPGVEASDDLDRVALLVVKGISDILRQEGHPFKLLSSEEAQDADIVIKGRIIEMDKRSSRIGKPWGKKPRELKLKVEGSILSVENEELLGKFAQSKDIRGKDIIFENLAYEIGEEIGRFLIEAAR